VSWGKFGMARKVCDDGVGGAESVRRERRHDGREYVPSAQ